MRPEYHVIASTVASAALYATTGSLPAAVACAVSGVAIDGDHVLDYMVEYGPRFQPRHFFDVWRHGALHRAFLVCHSWELVIILGIAGWFVSAGGILLGLFVGLGHHLLLDQLAYWPHPLAYTFLWRWRNGFELRRSFRNLPPIEDEPAGMEEAPK